MDKRIKRLRWKCRRGMKELDTVLLHYLEEDYSLSDATQKQAFELMLDMADPELWLLIVGQSTYDNKDVMGVVTKLQNTYNA